MLSGVGQPAGPGRVTPGPDTGRMANDVLYPHITDRLAAAHPEWVIWSDQHGWLPHVAGGADEGDASSGGEGDQGETGAEDGDTGEQGKTGEQDGDKVSMTQAELDALVQKRLGQAQKRWEKDQADAKAKAEMTEAERLKAEKADVEKAAAEQVTAANNRVIRAEAKAAALAAGVKPDRAAAFLRVADLDGIDVDDDGTPDSDAIAKAVKAVLDDFPEFKGSPKAGASGGEHGDQPKPKPTTLNGAVASHYADA